MTNRLSAVASRRVRKAILTQIESLEPRAYLTGVVLGTPQNLNAVAAGVAPVFINLDDLNGDGKADLISANDQSGTVPNSISVLNGVGDGTFGTAQRISLDFAPLPIAEAAFTAGGPLDIVAGSASAGVIGVTLNNGSGTFGASTDYTATGLANTHAIAVGDFNHDGLPDIAVISDDATTSNTTADFAVFLNNGNGTFTLGQELALDRTNMAAITSFTAGGQTDLAIANQSGGSVTILTGTGIGTFNVGNTYGVGSGPVSIVSADFNSDGSADLAVANSTSGNVSVLLGNGNGTFGTAINTAVAGVPGGGGPLKVRVANMNNDGKPDLLVLLGPGSSADADVMLGNGDGTFHLGDLVATGGNQRVAIAAGDLNDDGLTDLVLADPTEVTSLLNVTNQDHTPPTAAVDITQPAAVAGSPTIEFTVTYSDNTQVDATTLGNGNLTVTTPGGTSEAATLVSTNLGNAANVTATYEIAAPSGALSATDDGTYQVIATSNAAQAVKDANGNPLAGGNIGSFNILLPVSPSNGPNLVAGPVTAKLAAAVVGGSKGTGAKVVITNSGNQAATGTIVVRLYASTSNTAVLGDSTLLGTVTRKINLKVGKKQTISFPKFTWPSGVTGRYYLVADVNATDAITETNYADNLGASTTAVDVAPPFIDIVNNWNGAFKAPVAGRKVSLSISVKNAGNVTAKGAATIGIYASPDTSATDGTLLASVPAHLSVAAGKTAKTHATFTLPTTLAAGTYHLIVSVGLAGDTDTGNNTVASTATFTVA